MLKHQVRMEVVAKNGTKKVNVGVILSDLMKRANEHDKVDFFDIHGTPFDNDNFPEDQDFIERLASETVQNARNTKITMGFYMVSSATLQRIKKSIGYGWLNQQQIYLRTQRMPFTEGTDMFLMGYKIMENTTIANPNDIEREISDKWYSYMDKMAANHEMNDDDQEFLKNVTQMEEANIIVNDELKIPISAERTIIRVECAGKKPFEAPVFQIFVPRRVKVAANYLNDRALLETATLKNFIPFSIVKNNEEVYYRQMIQHAQYLHENRYVTIKNVPASDFDKVPEPTEGNSNMKSLHHAITTNKKIIKVHTHPERNEVTVETKSSDIREVEKWFDEVLEQYEYGPTRTKASSTGSLGQSSKHSDRYLKMYKSSDIDSTAEESFDPSTITTTYSRSKNQWKDGPPTNVSYNRKQDKRVQMVIDTDEDRSLTKENSSAYSGYGGIQNNSNYDERSVQTEITTLVEKAIAEQKAILEEKIKAYDETRGQLEERIKELGNQMSSMKKDIVESTVKDTLKLLTGTSTPFATKEDNIKLQEQTSQVIHAAVNTTNNEIASLKDGIATLLQRTNHLFATIHDPEEESPPRKTRHVREGEQIDENQTPHTPVRLFETADTNMQDMDGVGGD